MRLISIVVILTVFLPSFAYANKKTGFLVLNLDGKGVQYEKHEDKKGVYFDWEGDNFSNHTDWPKSGNAFFVKQGTKDNVTGKDILGGFNQSIKDTLSTLDTDGDDKISSLDSTWNDLLLWEDKNTDGLSQNDELQSLDDSLIDYISIESSNVMLKEGNTLNIDIFKPDFNKYNTRYSKNSDLKFETLFLPDVRGFGNLPDLRRAINEDDELIRMIQDFCVLDFDKIMLGESENQVDQIHYRWAKVMNIDPESRGKDIDARKLAFLETYLNEDFYNEHTGDKAPNPAAAKALNNIWLKLRTNNFYKILYQCHASKILEEKFQFVLAADKIISKDKNVSDKTIKNLIIIEENIKNQEQKDKYWNNAIMFLSHVFDEAKLVSFLERIKDVKKSSYPNPSKFTEDKPELLFKNSTKTSTLENENLECNDDIFYDCIAKSIYDYQPNKNYSLTSFNSSLGRYLTYFCDVKDTKFLEHINKEFNKYENLGALELFRVNANTKKYNFGRKSGVLEHACILDALGKNKEAIALKEKYSSKPSNKREWAHYNLSKGDLKGALEKMASITEEDIKNFRISKDEHGRITRTELCYDCSSIENGLIIKILRAALKIKNYELAKQAIELVPKFRIYDQEWDKDAAQRLFDREITSEEGTRFDRYCARAKKNNNQKNLLVCELLKKPSTTEKLKSQWSSYLETCNETKRSCNVSLLREYHNITI